MARPAACEHARLRASLALDGELTELERHGLDAHLDVCASCAAFARHIGAVTGGLRAAPLERFSAALRLHPARRRRHQRRLREVTSAAAALVLVVTGTTVLLAGRGSSDPTRDPQSLLSPFYAAPEEVAAKVQAQRMRAIVLRRNAQVPDGIAPSIPGPLAN